MSQPKVYILLAAIAGVVSISGATLGEGVKSPDGKMIALVDEIDVYDMRLVVRNINSGEEREFGEICGGVHSSRSAARNPKPSWSPDSRWIAVDRNMGDMACAPALFPAAGDQPIRNLAERGDTPVFSPDGRRLAYSDDKSVKLVRLGSDYRPAGPAVTIAQEPRPISGIKWTRDGKWIVYGALFDGPYLRRIALRPGAQPQTIPDPDSKRPVIETPFPSPDGRQQVFISNRDLISEIHVANADGTNERVLVKPVPGPVETIWTLDEVPNLAGWSPDGKWIAATVLIPGYHAIYPFNLYVVPVSGGQPRLVAREIQSFQWAPDSKSLTFTRKIGRPLGGRHRRRSAWSYPP